MRKFLIAGLILGVVVGKVFALSGEEVLVNSYDAADRQIKMIVSTTTVIRVDNDGGKTQSSMVVHKSTSSAFTVYMNGSDGSVLDALTLYIVGGSTTATATYVVNASSIRFVTTGGMLPGTTYWDFNDAAMDTLAEGMNHFLAVGASIPGIEGGLVVSTSSPLYVNILSARLTAVATTNCLAVGNIATLTVTPAADAGATFEIGASSITCRTANGLFPGTTWFIYAVNGRDTLVELIDTLNAVASTVHGADGGFVALRVQGSYYDNDTVEFTAAALADAHSSTHTLLVGFDNTLGMSYLIDAPSVSGETNYIENAAFAATFASGSTFVSVYDGIASTDSLLRYEEVGTTAIDDMLNLGSSAIFGTVDTATRFDIVGSSWITTTGGVSYINIISYTE